MKNSEHRGRTSAWFLFSGSALSLVATVVLILDLLSLKNSMLDDLQAQAQVVAETVNVSLWLESTIMANEMTDILAENPRIVEAALLDEDFELIKEEVGVEKQRRRAAFRRDASRPFVIPERRASWRGYQDGSLIVYEPIEFQTDEKLEPLGTVYIRADVSDLVLRRVTYLAIFLGLVLVTTILLWTTARRNEKL